LLRGLRRTYLHDPKLRSAEPCVIPESTMRPAIFDPFGERLDLRSVQEAGQGAACATRRRPVRTRRIIGAVLFWALVAGLIIARGAFFDPSTAFGPDAPARVAATDAPVAQAPVLR
jgi:hypothetical protein